MHNQPDAYDMKKAMELAASPEGRQLLELMQQFGGDSLRQALQKAAGGDYTAARKELSTLMASPQIKEALDKMGR